MCVRGTTVICSNTHANAANRAQTGEEPGTRRRAKKRKANTSAEAMESGKIKGGGGDQLDLFTSILQCGIGFDRVVSASNFCLKV